jgi:uncharacterized membrane protein (DUF485 family)
MADTATGGPAHHREVDWQATAQSPEFQELEQKRRSFVIPVLAFVFVWYFGFIALAGYAPDFMGESIYEGFTVGYALALSQFVMTWFLAWLYLRRSNRDFDPLAERVAKQALEPSTAERAEAERAAAPSRRFDPQAPDIAVPSKRAPEEARR